MADRKAYAGSHRKLVLAFDIGTTYSGVSFRFVYVYPALPSILQYCTASLIQAKYHRSRQLQGLHLPHRFVLQILFSLLVKIPGS